MKNRWRMILLLLLPLLLCGASCAEETLPRVRFYITHYIGYVGREVNVQVDCLNAASCTGKGEMFELRNAQGQVLATAQWRDLRKRLTFRVKVEEAMLGGHELSVWLNGQEVTAETGYAAFSDLSVKRITQLEPSEPAISLTIVCGGGTSRQVDEILAVLEKYDVKCTFFLSGGYLEAHTEDARRIVAAGHEIGSHGYQHIHMAESNNYRTMRRVITAMNKACEEKLGVRPRLFRPPYSETDQRVTALCRAEGMEEVIWSIDSRDWSDQYKRKPDAIIRRVTGKTAVSGSIIQFHLNGYHTAEVLDAVIPYYQNECGYRVVTVGELMALSGRELPPMPEELRTAPEP